MASGITIFLPDDFAGAFDDLFRQKQIPRNLPFYVSVPSETDSDLAPAGDTAMFVLVPTPLLSEVNGLDWDDAVGKVRQQVLERLWGHGVALDPECIVVEEVYTPAEWSRRFGLFDGSAFGAAHTLFQVGPFRDRNYSREVEGLFYVGASTTPGTGMPMVVLGGKLTAERISDASISVPRFKTNPDVSICAVIRAKARSANPLLANCSRKRHNVE